MKQRTKISAYYSTTNTSPVRLPLFRFTEPLPKAGVVCIFGEVTGCNPYDVAVDDYLAPITIEMTTRMLCFALGTVFLPFKNNTINRHITAQMAL